MRTQVQFEIDAGLAGMRLDRFLKKRFPKLPRGTLHKLVRRAAITVDGRRATAGQRLAIGNHVEVHTEIARYQIDGEETRREAQRLTRTKGFRRRFRVLYEDADLVVLNKPPGVVVHPGPEHHRGDTLLDYLRTYLAATGPSVGNDATRFSAAFVHRLDRGTSGVIVAAKSHEAARALERDFRERRVEKSYLALVRGHVSGEHGAIVLPLTRVRTARGTRAFARSPEVKSSAEQSSHVAGLARGAGAEPKEARTRFRVVERYRSATLLQVELDTGRTHQIRSHLAALGHPLAGDGDYGERHWNQTLRSRLGLKGLWLHATRVRLSHPRTAQELTLTAPLPETHARILARLSQESSSRLSSPQESPQPS